MTTVTAGANIDPDGYTLVVKPQVAGRDSLARTIAVNETITWEFEPVTSAVTLEDVQPNCLVSGDNPRLLTLIKGDTMSTSFTLSCS